MHILVRIAVLMALLPLNAGAVLPVLSPETIREALATVGRGRDESLFRSYHRFYPYRRLASVRAIVLTTPYSRLLSRVQAWKNIGKYTESQAERDYRQEGHAYLEVIVKVVCGGSPTPSSREAIPVIPGSTPCLYDFSLEKYQIAATYKDSPGGNPVSLSYADISRPRLPGDEEIPTGGELRIAIPLSSIPPNADLEVVVSEPDGYTTTASFELSQLL